MHTVLRHKNGLCGAYYAHSPKKFIELKEYKRLLRAVPETASPFVLHLILLHDLVVDPLGLRYDGLKLVQSPVDGFRRRKVDPCML